MSAIPTRFAIAPVSRREFLRRAFLSAGAVSSPAMLSSCLGTSSIPGGGSSVGGGDAAASRLANIGPLQAADANGLSLPAGFSSRVVAVSGEAPVLGGTYIWHTFPDGGATYSTDDGGWIYTSNSEVPNTGLPLLPTLSGGCGALRFDSSGQVVDAYSILTGTDGNCAGGKTPWQTWLSCEEPQAAADAPGLTYECDPFTPGSQGTALPALGIFKHEAVAVDPIRKILYLTEDEGSGRFYRFIPSAADWPAGAARPALQEGVLQVLRFAGGARGQTLDAAGLSAAMPHAVVWEDAAQADQPQSAVRDSLGADAPGSAFSGGEGLWYFDGIVYFSTKGDNRIWAYEQASGLLEVIYDFATSDNAILSGVDNLVVSEFGDVLVAEDGGDMQVNVILPNRELIPLVQASDASGQSELTGPALSPDGTRLYFSAQRNGRNGGPGPGITFEVQFPFSVCPSGQCPP